MMTWTNKIIRRLNKLPEQQELLLLAFIVGLGSGLAAALLINAIKLVQWILVGWFKTSAESLLYILYPGIGMLISYLIVRYVVRDDIGHGVTKVLTAISKNDSKIKRHNIWSSILTSSITIGFGGSVGAEAPIVYAGAAIGSNLADKLGLSRKNITLLLGCGACGAIAGIFKAPMTGVLFALEILMFSMSMSSILPLVVSSVTATVVSYFLRGSAVEFGNTLTPFQLSNIPFYLIFGILCGFASLYFTRATLWSEDRLKRIQNPFNRWLVCAICMGVLLFLLPPLYGEGYNTLTYLLNNDSIGAVGTHGYFANFFTREWIMPLFFFAVFLFKVISMTCTNSGGGVGGTFGPTLFMGGVFGFLFARVSNLAGLSIPESNFVLVGMAGLMAGVMHAPLTAIFLIAEITGGYTLLIPLIITSAASYAVIRNFEPYSIYTKRIAKEKSLLTHDSDKAVLTLLRTAELVERDFTIIRSDETLGEFVKDIAHSTRNIYPVVGADGALQGIVYLDTVKEDMFDRTKYSTSHVYDYMVTEFESVLIYDHMDTVVRKFERSGAWNIPVLDKSERYIGFISRSNIFSAYRDRLRQVTGD